MRALPDGVHDRDLLDALREGWGVDAIDATYVPVGGGSYHWHVGDGAGVRHWVTVDDLDNKGFLGHTPDVVMDGMRRAFDTAYALRAGGVEFVVAPVPTSDGESVRRLGHRHAISLFPYVTAPAGRFGEYRTPAERVAVIDALVRLHRAPPARARAVVPEGPHRTGLERALVETDRPWSSGPYAERARTHLATHADEVHRLLTRFDSLTDKVAATGASPVLTHGEPHPGNVVFADDHVLLIDWDTVAVAIPERDLWMLDSDEARAQYAAASGRPVDDAAINLYRLRWHLDDISTAVHELRSPHVENADTALTWRWFGGAFESDGPRPYAP